MSDKIKNENIENKEKETKKENPKKVKQCEVVTNLEFLDPEKADKILKEKHSKGIIIKYVYCIHNKDTYSLEDEKKNPANKEGTKKNDHIHIFIKLDEARTPADIAKWFGLAENTIQFLKQRIYDKACLYVIHANAPEKYQYSVDEAVASVGFDFKAVVEEAQKNYIREKSKDKAYKRKMEIASLIDSGVINKINISQYLTVEEEINYNAAIKIAFERKEREISLIKDRVMDGIYIVGKSGTAKTTLAKMIASSLGFNFGVSGSDRDPVQDYKGEDCYILDDASPLSFNWKEYLKFTDNNTTSAVGSRNKDKHFGNCKLMIITQTEEPRVFVDQIKGSTGEAKKQFYRRFKTMYKLIDSKILIYEYDEKEDKYIYVKTERNKAIDYVRILEVKNPKKTYTNVSNMLDNFFENSGMIVLDLEKHEEKEEPKKEVEKPAYKKTLKFIEVDDCKIAYTGSGSSFEYSANDCLIPEKYNTVSQRKEIINKFLEKKNAIEEQERKAKQEAEQKAKEEEKRKTALSGADLLDWLDNAKKEVENIKALEDDFYNDPVDDDFFG